MESQNVSPLIITPTPHVIHTSNDVVPAKVCFVMIFMLIHYVIVYCLVIFLYFI